MTADRVDVLVITALPQEHQALCAVRAGVREPWTTVKGEPPLEVAVLEGEAGPIRVAAAPGGSLASPDAEISPGKHGVCCHTKILGGGLRTARKVEKSASQAPPARMPREPSTRPPDQILALNLLSERVWFK